MLQRTLSRQGDKALRRRRPWRPLVPVAALVAALAGLYLALPNPGPRIRPVALDDAQLKARVAALHPAALPAPTRAEKDLAALGRKLFNDVRFAPGSQQSCASCHDPAKGFADGLPTPTGAAPLPRNTPSLANAGYAPWLGWDGRADSVAAFVLQHAEDPRVLGASRLSIVHTLRHHYLKEYDELFGAFPEELRGKDLPAQGQPAPPREQLAIDVSAQALATVGSSALLESILKDAQRVRLAPAMELSHRALARWEPPIAYVAAYEALPPATRAAVDHVYAGFGKALEAYVKSLVALDSPFDRFARKLEGGASVADAMDTGFAEKELTGLELFLGPGQCALCHYGETLSDGQFHNLGLGARGDLVDVGRAAGVLRAKADPYNCHGTPGLARPDGAPASESCRELPFLDAQSLDLIGAFRTPSLRNVAQTAPYMHDGRFATLEQVLAHYERLEDRPAFGRREGTLKPLGLTVEERAALVAFLQALSSPVRDVSAEEATSGR